MLEDLDFKNEKAVKDALERWQADDLFEAAIDVRDLYLLRNAVKAVEKQKASELLKAKDNPEKWLEIYRVDQKLDRKLSEVDAAFRVTDTNEQILFDVLTSLVIVTVLHEQIDIDPEYDGLDVASILEKATPVDEVIDTEVEKDEDYKQSLEKATLKDLQKVHARLAGVLTKFNNAYTLKRADYKIETVKMPTANSIGRMLFPSLFANATKKIISKTPCGKGRGDWVETPTSYILARTCDMLQEIKGRLSMEIQDREDQDAAIKRRKMIKKKIKETIFFWKNKKDAS
ncbi:MAG: hypothetical protein MJ250_05995 [Alphaproteobacteria bacterium]|nr:hypothetical protein [Alphaproteobacteria bacterium]